MKTKYKSPVEEEIVNSLYQSGEEVGTILDICEEMRLAASLDMRLVKFYLRNIDNPREEGSF